MGIRGWLSKAADAINDAADEARLQQKLRAWEETKARGYGRNYDRLQNEEFEKTGGGLAVRDLTVLFLWSASEGRSEDRQFFEYILRTDPQIKSRLLSDRKFVSKANTAAALEFCEAVDGLVGQS
ncbi:hypothetical protein [Pseudomonas sp. DP-17]|uniref:hypothetical protein n=1 Tax=Pseudomonas sp. DP-17 TaxID=1580486 RepID=UPI001EFBFADF|nr:hypothetical protein [Pseudomonas sp. DP-17]MCG8910291.1 hypothetical protein [Pseudomonas sp. DP-17]